MATASRRRFDTFEVLLLLLLGGGVAFVWANRRSDTELLDQYRARFGPVVASHGPEEWIIRDYFNDQRGGVFVDVGAGPARDGSNTYFLEVRLGWSGIAIDAQSDYAPEYRALRPRTRFVPAFIDAGDGKPAELWIVPHRPPSSSRDRSFARFYAGWRGEPVRRTFTTTTLDTLLSSQKIGAIDYLNLDVEMSEPQALAGLTLPKYTPRLVSVEAHMPVRQAILNYFATHQYVLIGKDVWDDETNLWFRPLTEGPAIQP